MIAKEKVCASCGRNFIVREAESHNWQKINYCTICSSAFNKKKQKEKEQTENQKWAETQAKNQALFEEEIANRNVVDISDIRFDDDNILYIIGNGFDLMHGVKSSYYAFRDSLGKNSALRLFVFVRDRNDYIIYAATSVISNAGANVFNYV